MFSVVRTPHPSTGIEHSIQARFFGPLENNLVVAGTDNLRIFRLVPDIESNMFHDADSPKVKLECLATYKLFGEYPVFLYLISKTNQINCHAEIQVFNWSLVQFMYLLLANSKEFL